ncbi:MAG: isoprenylcysteine carboxylmethyltransferase family protein [Verrucomicrobiia bacterium]
MPDGKSLKSRLVRRGLLAVLLLAAMLFIPAGTLKFWQGWAFMISNLISSALVVIYFFKRDPQLLERRLLNREKISEQRLVQKLGGLIFFPSFLLPGLDYRFGWSRTFPGPVPLWLTLLALALIVGCQFLFFQVLNVNRFAARVIQVEAGQTVASTGPYRLVRHPMYLGLVVLYLCAPLALGSFIALPAFALLIPVVVFRLLNEEKILRHDLPGYSEYCRHTRFRLVPFVW